MTTHVAWVPKAAAGLPVTPSTYGGAEAALNAFRGAMRRLAGHVNVVTTRLGDARSGLTATAVCSLTAQPPRILACINLAGRSFRMLSESRVMAINVLGAEHCDLARRFSTPSIEDPFEGPERWTQASTGAPILEGSQASFDCEIEQIVMTSTHAIVIGDIRHISHGESGRPLLYSCGQFVSTGVI